MTDAKDTHTHDPVARLELGWGCACCAFHVVHCFCVRGAHFGLFRLLSNFSV